MQKYIAYQITKLLIDNDRAILLLLDWSGDELPKENEIHSMRPLFMDFNPLFGKRLCIYDVKPKVPRNYILAGNIPPLSDEYTQFSNLTWEYDDDIYHQLKWMEIPEEKRNAFESAIKCDKKIMLSGQEVPAASFRIEDSGLDFKSAMELGALPCLSILHCERWHDDLCEYVRSNPFLRILDLRNHGHKSLDFRGSRLERLSIQMDTVEEIYLNDEMEKLSLTRNIDHAFVVHAKDGGKRLLLQSDMFVAECGLPNLGGLHCSGLGEFDMSKVVAAYPELWELRLWGKPGYIRNFRDVSLLKNLEKFSTDNLFGFTAEDIPEPDEMPKLNWFWMSSLPEDAAKAARRLYKKPSENGLDLWIGMARKPEWLRENLDNPFRDWDGQEHISTTNARKAAAQYRKTRSEILKLVENHPDDLMIKMEGIVRDYAEAFNKMDKRKNFIETVEREQIFEVLDGLLRLIPESFDFDKNTMLELFEGTRDF
ncbi:MAG: gliding motility protein [Betaproteobacteria bacterium]|nr:gliding motility protein [Betaproteobacteria bacterium]